MHGNHKIDGRGAVACGEILTRVMAYAADLELTADQMEQIAFIQRNHRVQYLTVAAQCDAAAAAVAAMDKAPDRNFPIDEGLVDAHVAKLKELTMLTLTNIRAGFMVLTDAQRDELRTIYENEKAICPFLPAGRQ